MSRPRVLSALAAAVLSAAVAAPVLVGPVLSGTMLDLLARTTTAGETFRLAGWACLVAALALVATFGILPASLIGIAATLGLTRKLRCALTPSSVADR